MGTSLGRQTLILRREASRARRELFVEGLQRFGFEIDASMGATMPWMLDNYLACTLLSSNPGLAISSALAFASAGGPALVHRRFSGKVLKVDKVGKVLAQSDEID